MILIFFAPEALAGATVGQFGTSSYIQIRQRPISKQLNAQLDWSHLTSIGSVR